MKLRSLFFIGAAALVLSSCSEKDPTACECHEAIKKDGTEADIYSVCQSKKTADTEFGEAMAQCAANDILKGNTKVEKMESKDLAIPESGTFVVDTAASSLSWEGKKITGKKHNGLISFNSGELQFENGMLSGGTFKINMGSITVTDLKNEDSKAKLEGHLNSPDFFDTTKFPEGTYEITQVTPGENNSFEVIGKMTVKGITNEVKSNVILTMNGDKLIGGGTMNFDRSKFDVRYGSGSFFDDLGDDLIEDMILVKIKLIASANQPA